MIKCAMCGKEFVKQSNNQKYCCKECSKAANQEYTKEYNPMYKQLAKPIVRTKRKKHDPWEWLENINKDLKAGKYHGTEGAVIKSKEPWFKGA